MSKSLRKNDLSLEAAQCSLIRIISGYLKAVDKHYQLKSHITLNLDLFHRFCLELNPSNVDAALSNLLNLMIASNPTPLIWIHSIDDEVNQLSVVTLRIGHEGSLDKDLPGFHNIWEQLVNLSPSVHICKLKGGREEYVIQLKASSQLEVEPPPETSFDLSVPGFPKVG